jgi:hypothetical protein
LIYQSPFNELAIYFEYSYLVPNQLPMPIVTILKNETTPIISNGSIILKGSSKNNKN